MIFSEFFKMNWWDPRGLKISGPPYNVEKNFIQNLGFMGVIRTGWLAQFQNCWNFCSSMFVAWEIIKKLPKIGWFDSGVFFSQIWIVFLMISQATSMLEQKFHQFWTLLSQPVLMTPINPIFSMKKISTL